MAKIENSQARIETVPPEDGDMMAQTHSVEGTSVIRRRAAPLDAMSITPEQMEEWRIPYNKDTGEPKVGLAWVRDPDSNIHKNAPENRIASLRRELDGSGPVLHQGKRISRDDVLLYQYPIGYKLGDQKAIDDASRQFETGLESAPTEESPGALESRDEFDIEGRPYVPLTPRQQERYMDQMRRYHQETGMIGNVTGGLSLSDAIRVVGGPEAALAEEALFRDGAVYREISQEEFGKMFASGITPGSKAVRNFHAMGNSGIGKTTQQKVQATSAAGRRAAALAAGKKG